MKMLAGIEPSKHQQYPRTFGQDSSLIRSMECAQRAVLFGIAHEPLVHASVYHHAKVFGNKQPLFESSDEGGFSM